MQLTLQICKDLAQKRFEVEVADDDTVRAASR